MQVRVLGSAAGGGFPQWNCNCDNCLRLRAGRIAASPRTQSSIAISTNGHDWILINASPDILQQINAFAGFHPAKASRDTGIRAVVLVDSQIDHTTGLLMLRESSVPLELYCTERVREDLTSSFPVMNILEHYCGVNWHRIGTDGKPFRTEAAPELSFTAIPLSSKPPPYSRHRKSPNPGDNIGLSIEDASGGGRLFYAPGLGRLEPHVAEAMQGADCLLVDGTTWTDDEMARRGVGTKLASEMGHLAQSGPGGMIEQLRRYPGQRRILIHINNTNPILDEDSPESATLAREGIEVAYDGMQFDV